MSDQQPQRNEQGLLYNDDAHRDAWSGLLHLGVWDLKITPEMVGKTFGEAIDALFDGTDVPNEPMVTGQSWLESQGFSDAQLALIAAGKGRRTTLVRPE